MCISFTVGSALSNFVKLIDTKRHSSSSNFVTIAIYLL